MTIKDRRSIRHYSADAVSEELLNSIIDEAQRASNTGNMQTYSVIITRDDAQKKLLAPAHFNQPMVTSAPIVLTICADFHRFSRWCEERRAIPGFDNIQSFVGASIDAMLLAQNIATIAEREGLGICFLGTTTYNALQIIDALKLPGLVMPLTTITMGYPASMPEQPDRIPVSGIIHNETYREYTSAEINALYEQKEARDDSKKFIEENNKETLAQVFTDVRYPKSASDFFSVEFIKALRRQGFIAEEQ
jgi:nitroreductase